MATVMPDVIVYAGDTIVWPTYTFLSAPSTPINLVTAGWITWQAEWRKTTLDPIALNLIVDTSAATTGSIIISADPATTRLMGQKGVWDLQSTKADGTIKTWVYGKTTYVNDVTHV